MTTSRFVALVFLLGITIRLVQINQPYVDAWSWRQADVAMIAENFYIYGYDFFHPQINWGGNVPGYVGTEFPFIPFIASILYALFGIQEWIGRSISNVFFAISVPYLYLLFRKFLSQNAAVFGITVYVFLPLGIFSGRSFMSDTPALCFTIMGLFYFSEWMDDFENPRLMILSIVMSTFALLLKPSSVVMALPSIFLAYRRWGKSFLKKQHLWTYLVVTLFFPCLWYFHANNIGHTEPPYSMFGKGSVRFERAIVYWNIVKQTALTSLTIPITSMVLAGTILALIRQRATLFLFWFAATVVFVIIFGAGNKDHPWYRLPFLPVAAALSGVALDEVRHLIVARSMFAARAFCVIFFCIYGIESYRAVRVSYEPIAAGLASLGDQLRISTSASDLIVIVDHGDPTALYYARRKGWHFLPRFGHQPKTGKTAIRELEKLRTQGATHLAFPGRALWWLEYYKDFAQHLKTNYRCIHCTGDSVIFDLRKGRFSSQNSIS